VGGECIGSRSYVATGWGRTGGGGEVSGREWIRRGRKSSLEGEKWVVAQEKEGT
jgi:hypothetical protein